MKPARWKTKNRGKLSPVRTMRVSVRLRSIDVQTGVVRWTGSATASSDDWSGMFNVQNPEGAAGWLAGWAFRRALCPTDGGWTWVKPSGDWGAPKRGCIAPAGQTQTSQAVPFNKLQIKAAGVFCG